MGNVVVRPCFAFLMNFDRRVMAGAAAKSFQRVCELVESVFELGFRGFAHGNVPAETIQTGESIEN